MAAKSDGAPVSLPSSTLPRNHHALPADCTPPHPPLQQQQQQQQQLRSPAGPPLRSPAAAEGSYSLADCGWTLCALLVFFSDGASDLWLAADYYLRQEYRWFALTLVFVVAPSVVVQALSFRWFAYDYAEESDAEGGGGVGGITVRGGEALLLDEEEEQQQGSFSTKDSAAQHHQRGAGRDAAAGPTPSPGGGGGGGVAAGARGRSSSSCCRVCMWTFQSVIHLLQLAQVWRYVHALYLGVQSRWHGDHKRHHFYWRVMLESADISMLRLLESFLKSAPQLVLQLSIMVHTSQVLPLQGLSASASLLSLSWMLSSYQKVLRDSRDDKRPMSYRAVAVHLLWHLFSVGARALAFALFASVFTLYFGVFVVAHWCLMTFWIIQGETDFCMSKWEEIIYNMMVGVVYVFCWFGVREGRTRCRMALYGLVVFAQNVALTAAWYVYRGGNGRTGGTGDFTAVVLVCAVASSYALGTFFMFVYYCLLHPDGPISGWGGFMEDKEEERLPPDVLGSPASTLPPDVVSSPPRTLQRTKGGELGGGIVGDVFQVRGGARQAVASSGASRLGSPGSRTTEGPVIRIDLPRKRYPAWDAHVIDRRLRKTILVLEGAAPVTPRIQYRCLGAPTEVMEYETTV